MATPPPTSIDMQTRIIRARQPGITTAGTRFPRQLIGTSYLDRLQVVNDSTKIVIKRVQQDRAVWRLGYHGVVDRDPQYQLDLSFSDDDGQSFSATMFNITGNRVFQWRCQFGQLQAEPLLHGVALQWLLPTGWVFTDGIGVTTYEECVSNPTVITRTIRSPSNPQPAAFEVDVLALYPY